MATSALRRTSSILLIVAASGCAEPPDVSAPIGSPLPGLTANELARFREGLALFNRVYTAEEGLGPLFNENQCSACHTDPAAGGTGEQILVRASRFTPPDQCDLLETEGGENVRTQATAQLRAHGIDRQPFPPSATETGRFTVTFLFGLGLIEAIPEHQILRHADPDDRRRDGITGRPGRDAQGRLARFGRKADHATIPDFIETALRLEMGLTTPSRPHEAKPSTVPWPEGVDAAHGPEIDERTIARLHDFVRFLAPPARRIGLTEEDRSMVVRGEALFHSIGCTACHVPELRTGRSDIAALDRKAVRLYSDLLLHDLGPELANACGVGASPTELRTGILMGVGHRRELMHHGRAVDFFQAIGLHGGEAAAARERFRALDRLEQEYVIRFLRSL